MKLSLILLLFSISTWATAQTSYRFRHYGREEGLSNTNVNCAMQDKRGLLWVGTSIGLNRFDGSSFHNYFMDLENENNSIPSNNIVAIAETNDKLLWIGTNNGLCSFDAEYDKFTNIQIPGLPKNAEIYDMGTDKKGILWIISNHGLTRFDTKKKNAITFDIKKHFEPMSFCFTHNGKIWVSDYEGRIHRFEELTNSFTSFDIFNKAQQKDNKSVNKIVELQDGTMALLSDHLQGVRFSPSTGQTSKLFQNDTALPSVLLHTAVLMNEPDGEQKLWLATEDGIYIYSLNNGNVEHIHKNYGDPFALSDNAVHVLKVDNEGGIWVGTFFGGMNYLPPKSTEMFNIMQMGDNNGIPEAKIVREMVTDTQGRMWIGTEDGGVFLKDDAIKRMNLSWMGAPIKTNIQSLMTNGDDLWIGTLDAGIYICDTRKMQIKKQMTTGFHGLKSNTIVRMEKTNDGRILIGTMNSGVLEYLTESDSFQVFGKRDKGFVHDIYQDSSGKIWIADLSEGIYMEKEKNGELKHVFPQIHNATTIFEDSRKQMWIGTQSFGLFMIDSSGKCIRPIPELSNSGIGIYKIKEDAEGKLWITTSDGLYNYDDTVVKRYTSANGLPSEQFNFNSGFSDNSGRIYFGTLGGLVSFIPNSSKPESKKWHVLFTGICIDGKEVNYHPDSKVMSKSILYADEINIYHGNTSASIDFACPVMSNAESMWYRYKLEGEQSEWTVTKGAQRLTLAGLYPGTYKLMVQASNENGRWDESETSEMKIIVHRPWWNSIWAWMIYLLALATTSFYIYRHVAQRRKEKSIMEAERKENEQYRDMLQSKIQFFTTITHEIRTPLSLIMGSIERLEEERKQLKLDNKNNEKTLPLLKRNAQRLLDLVNQLLDFRKIESLQFLLFFENIDICDLLKEVCTDFTSAARQKSINYDINIDKNLDTHVLADKEALIKIFSNLLSNAMKFSEKRVYVNLTQTENKHVNVTVENDGPHIPDNQIEEIFKPFYQYYGNQVNATVKGSGLGLPLARSLAEMMNGSLIYDKKSSENNRFILSFPLYAKPEDETDEENNTINDTSTTTNEKQDSLNVTESDDSDTANKLPTLLIVDDESELREFICDELKAHYNILQADNGKLALEILKENNVALVVTDIMMPVMNGMELCNEIKKNKILCHIPIIVLTAKVSMQDHIDALETGADAYIEKPFSTHQLKAQIDNLLHSRELLRKAFLSSPYSAITSVANNSVDEIILEKLNAIVSKYLDNPSLTVDFLASEMNMSASTLYRKVKALTSLPPNDFIRLCRLKKAAELLSTGSYKIKEVASMTSFSSVTYFTSCFMRQFGITPGVFVNQRK